MGVELPADLVRDYAILELLDESESSAMVSPTSPISSIDQELLADCTISDDTSFSFTAPSTSPNLKEFLLEDEKFLQDMELQNDATNLPDLDVELSLSLCLGVLQDTPCKTDEELDSPLFNSAELMLLVSRLKQPHSDSASVEWIDDSAADSEFCQDEELLQREVDFLTAKKEFLEFKEKKRRKSGKSRSRRDELKIMLKSQENNQLLHGLVVQQNMYADNFKALLACAPVNDIRLSLMTPLESCIHLGKKPNERRDTILSLRKEKLDMTYKFIEHKTLGMDCSQPYEFSDMFDRFGKHYCVHFMISRYDGVSIDQVAQGIYNQLTEKDNAVNEAIGVTASREATGTLTCSFMHQRIITRPKQTDAKATKMPDMESNGNFYCRFEDDSAILATDYVDRDDLYPYDERSRIRKDLSSGVVLTTHEDTDGKRYMVMKRYMMAKLHMYLLNVSQKEQDRFFLKLFHSHDCMKKLVVDRVLQRNETGCSSTGDTTSCCCASNEGIISCEDHNHTEEICVSS